MHVGDFAQSGQMRRMRPIGDAPGGKVQCQVPATVFAFDPAIAVAVVIETESTCRLERDPGTAFNLGLARYPPARKLITAGVPVALASDFNPGSCFTLNMQMILSIACSQMKMTAAESIAAATINGAYSLALSDRLGSIEEGKQADIVLMNVSDYREIPYFFGVNHCVVTIKKGNLVVNKLERHELSG